LSFAPVNSLTVVLLDGVVVAAGAHAASVAPITISKSNIDFIFMYISWD